MPVNVPDGLPAIDILSKENIFLMTEQRAKTQDIRPLEIAIVNLMPTKITTETQLLRLLSNTPIQIHVTLVQMSGHTPKNTSAEHMEAFYTTSSEILKRRFDGLIVTGAPVEHLAFEQVRYWQRLKELFAWSKTHVYSSLFICWGANAALYHFYGIDKHIVDNKISGVYELEVLDKSSHLLRGFDDYFLMPQSRFTTVLPEDLEGTGLKLLAGSEETGAVVFASSKHRQIFVTGHPEYDNLTLDSEYQRDQKAGLDTPVPVNYYKDDNPDNPPRVQWKTSAHLFFANWLNHYVYQETPFDLGDLT